MNYADILAMQGGNQQAAQLQQAALAGNAGPLLLGAAPATRPQGQIPRQGQFSTPFDMNGLLEQARAQAPDRPSQAPIPLQSPYPQGSSQPTGQTAIQGTSSALPVNPAPAPSLANTLNQSNQAFAQAVGLPVPGAAPISPYASPAAVMAMTPNYSDILFGTSRSENNSYYDPLKGY